VEDFLHVWRCHRWSEYWFGSEITEKVLRDVDRQLKLKLFPPQYISQPKPISIGTYQSLGNAKVDHLGTFNFLYIALYDLVIKYTFYVVPKVNLHDTTFGYNCRTQQFYNML